MKFFIFIVTFLFTNIESRRLKKRKSIISTQLQTKISDLKKIATFYYNGRPKTILFKDLKRLLRRNYPNIDKISIELDHKINSLLEKALIEYVFVQETQKAKISTKDHYKEFRGLSKESKEHRLVEIYINQEMKKFSEEEVLFIYNKYLKNNNMRYYFYLIEFNEEARALEVQSMLNLQFNNFEFEKAKDSIGLNFLNEVFQIEIKKESFYNGLASEPFYGFLFPSILNILFEFGPEILYFVQSQFRYNLSDVIKFNGKFYVIFFSCSKKETYDCEYGQKLKDNIRKYLVYEKIREKINKNSKIYFKIA